MLIFPGLKEMNYRRLSGALVLLLLFGAVAHARKTPARTVRVNRKTGKTTASSSLPRGFSL